MSFSPHCTSLSTASGMYSSWASAGCTTVAAQAIPSIIRDWLTIMQPQVMAVPGSLLWDEKELAHNTFFIV